MSNHRLRSAALGATLLTAFALSGPVDAATPPNTLVVATSIDDAVSFDPAEGFELTTVQSFNNLYQRLVRPSKADPNKIEPTLAESWAAAPDGKSLTFKLRAGASFASGNPVRPEDVIFSLSRAVKLNKSPAFILNELGWTSANVDGLLIKVDESHVKLTWPADVGPGFALAILTAPIASIVDEKVATTNAKNGDFGNEWLKTHSAGSGTFSIAVYQPHEALVFAANPKAPLGAPKLNQIVFRNIPDQAARRLLVEQGDADIARGLGSDQVSALKGKPGLKVEEIASARTDYLRFNTTNSANPALANPALWEAARWLIDYEGIAKDLLKGSVQVHQSFLPEGFPGALTDNPYKLDIEKAKAILAKAGLDKGLTIKFTVFNTAPFTQIAQSLQETFGKAGITLDIQPGVASEVYAKGRARQDEATWRYWIPDYFDPNSNASAFTLNRGGDGPKNAAWQAGWVIPQLSDKTQAAVREQDPAKRIQIYQELQREVQTNSPFIFTFQGRDPVVLRDNVKGYFQGLNADQVYYEEVQK
ncbi:ABC transporter substrate-binding protein [Microvirga alba]|uniref:ABC transporter substrate-binding protein n=1 Tax=Microvirga alba TaxID=2791025 RepID=A0A931BMF7_9HYPH|nr:ABC transporter substrate-binding protein [Microvirga alba]MBF9233926.1 ABC transporter substrate-binding protein [Microvirga alba]